MEKIPEIEPKVSKSQEPNAKSEIIKDDEIDLIELIKVIWSKRWFIAKVTSVFVALGLVIAFTSPEEYTTSSTLIPEAAGEEGNLGGSLGGLASLAGVDLGSLSGGVSQTINPALYQSVSQSTPFLMQLMNEEYYFFEVGDTISVYEYFMEHSNSSLFQKALAVPGTIIGFILGKKEKLASTGSDSTTLLISKEQQGVMEILKSRVYVEMDWELNIVTIQVEMQDPVVAAKMVTFTRDYITEYVTEYSTSKSQQRLSSIEKQYLERKAEFEMIQLKLASFRDRNQNVTTARARSEEERLQSEYNLSFNIFNQISQQREAVKLQIEENTPVFTVLEPVKVPVEKSKPKRLFILILAGLFGGIVGTGWVTIRFTPLLNA